MRAITFVTFTTACIMLLISTSARPIDALEAEVISGNNEETKRSEFPIIRYSDSKSSSIKEKRKEHNLTQESIIEISSKSVHFGRDINDRIGDCGLGNDDENLNSQKLSGSTKCP